MGLYDVIIRLLLSLLLSGLIGYERERTNKPAGLRTHILISLGATTIMMANFMLFEQFEGRTNMDPARLGAQVISGIGFLGAGTIFKEGVNVKGLTTAATTWVVGCIGLVVGSGYYYLSILATIAVLVTLHFFINIEDLISFENRYYNFTLEVEDGIYTNEILDFIESKNISIISFDTFDGTLEFTLKISKDGDYMELLRKLSNDERISYLNVSQET